MRNIPIIVFINKMDREGKDAFDLLDEVEQKLGLKVTPLEYDNVIGQAHAIRAYAHLGILTWFSTDYTNNDALARFIKIC